MSAAAHAGWHSSFPVLFLFGSTHTLVLPAATLLPAFFCRPGPCRAYHWAENMGHKDVMALITKVRHIEE
jgi:hypothetical protein